MDSFDDDAPVYEDNDFGDADMGVRVPSGFLPPIPQALRTLTRESQRQGRGDVLLSSRSDARSIASRLDTASLLSRVGSRPVTDTGLFGNTHDLT